MDHEANSVFTYRAYTSEDLPFIHSSWENSYFQNSPNIKHLTRAVFRTHHRPIRERILGSPQATIIICSPKDDPNLILGWIAVETIHTRDNKDAIILHYLYVKEVFKKEKIATTLIGLTTKNKSPIFMSHLTERAKKIMKLSPQRFLNFHYLPHLV